MNNSRDETPAAHPPPVADAEAIAGGAEAIMKLDERGRMSEWLEQAWLQRYLDRELSEDERTRFEIYLLQHPSLATWIEADNLLRDTLAAAPAGDTLFSGSSGTDSPGLIGWKPMLAAASIVAAVGVGWMMPRTAEPEWAVPARVLYDSYRGTTEVAAAPVMSGPAGASLYVADIAVTAGTMVIRVEAELPDDKLLLSDAPHYSDGFLTLILPLAWRDAGVLVLHTTSTDGSSPATLRIKL
jgi:hypothetical protein